MDGNKKTEIMNSYQLPIPISQALEAVKRDIKDILFTNDTELRLFFDKVSACGGKMLRASLLLLFADNNGGITENHKKAATSAELIHLASLLHDDVVDGSSYRRGDKSFNAVFGSKNAVLMGDFLVSKALSTAADFLARGDYKSIFEVVSAMSKAELLQSANRGNPEMTAEKYFAIIEGKTAELFSLCCKFGYLERANEEEKSIAAEFGRNFGIAYQIKNDYNNIYSRENPADCLSCDIENGNFSLPVIDCISGGQRQEIIDAIEKKDVASIIRISNLNGSKSRTLQQIDSYKQKALDCLSRLPKNKAAHSIERFTQEVLAI